MKSGCIEDGTDVEVVEANMNECEVKAVSGAGVAAREQRSFHGVVDLFTGCASSHPEALAIQAQGVMLNYGQLQTQASRLARYLRLLGVGPEVVVAVCLPRSIALVVAELAILEAGGAYLPLDPGHPAERVSFLLNDAGVSLVLAPQCTAEQLPRGPWQAIGLDPQGRGEFGEGSCTGADQFV